MSRITLKQIIATVSIVGFLGAFAIPQAMRASDPAVGPEPAGVMPAAPEGENPIEADAQLSEQLAAVAAAMTPQLLPEEEPFALDPESPDSSLGQAVVLPVELSPEELQQLMEWSGMPPLDPVDLEQLMVQFQAQAMPVEGQQPRPMPAMVENPIALDDVEKIKQEIEKQLKELADAIRAALGLPKDVTGQEPILDKDDKEIAKQILEIAKKILEEREKIEKEERELEEAVNKYNEDVEAYNKRVKEGEQSEELEKEKQRLDAEQKKLQEREDALNKRIKEFNELIEKFAKMLRDLHGPPLVDRGGKIIYTKNGQYDRVMRWVVWQIYKAQLKILQEKRNFYQGILNRLRKDPNAKLTDEEKKRIQKDIDEMISKERAKIRKVLRKKAQ